MSRMSEFNSKFGGGGARQLRCQGIHSFLHTLIVISAPAEVGLALEVFILPPTSSFLRSFYLLDSSVNISTCLSALVSSYTKSY